MNNTGTKKKGMRLKSKLAMVYILAGFLPIVVILFVNYFQMRSVFKSQEKNTLYSFIKRSTLDLDDKFKKYAELAKLITNDENVNDILSTIYLDDNRINEKFDLSVAPSLDTFIYFHNEVSKITIYTDRIVDYKNKYLAPIEELKKADEIKTPLDNVEDKIELIDEAKIKTLETSCYNIIDVAKTTYMESLMGVETILFGYVDSLDLVGEKPLSGTWEYIEGKGIKIEGVKFASAPNYSCSNDLTTGKVSCVKD